MDKTKTIIKEIGIVLLLLLAVSLLLAIVFYDYIPNNKTLPVKIQAYDVPEDIKKEISEAGLNEQQNIVHIYFIDDKDLDVYESTNDYNKGKANPFADYTNEDTTNTNNTTSNNANGNNTNKNTNASENNLENNSYKNEVYITTPGKNY